MSIFGVILVLLAAGVLNAGFLYWQYHEYRTRNRPMVCPLGGSCEDVVSSSYGETLGVKNELWGVLFYTASLFLFTLYRLSPPLQDVLRIVILGSGVVAFLASLYLTAAQIFLLKKYCSWCLVANAINAALFVLELLYFFPL